MATDIALPGPPPNVSDESLLATFCQQTKASRTLHCVGGTKVFDVGVIEGRRSRYTAETKGSENGIKLQSVPPRRQVGSEACKERNNMMIIEGSDYCKSSMRI